MGSHALEGGNLGADNPGVRYPVGEVSHGADGPGVGSFGVSCPGEGSPAGEREGSPAGEGDGSRGADNPGFESPPEEDNSEVGNLEGRLPPGMDMAQRHAGPGEGAFGG